jgi:hypothetical protein
VQQTFLTNPSAEFNNSLLDVKYKDLKACRYDPAKRSYLPAKPQVFQPQKPVTWLHFWKKQQQ